ncbi:glutamine synthetase family protein [Sphingomonas fennica]|uniref:Glutamine synthetase n=1 Tax=Edaphosphingomonas fennica TaxID=114404 RepID=A0A2T4I8J5_9SPHN|nr:glutamine synthetase family protein [Sphingomonas fennica]PTD28083.1 glutamine synthetase [Sphingomonas fennica]
MRSFREWITANGISEVECLVPDMNGVIRGKVWPAQKFLQSVHNGSLRMPSSIFNVTVTGEYADEPSEAASYSDPDVSLHPDPASLCVAPGFKTPTAFVFADAHHKNGDPYEIAPRHVLKKVLAYYEAMSWEVVVAPELEFYLTKVNTDPDLPLEPPAGRSGRAETAPQPYGLEAVTEYEDLIEDIYEQAEAASLHLDTMIHEAGTAQLEINFNHGEPIHLCDQVLVFKRIVRQVALKHGVYATFMAKPMEHQPGSAMHLHISARDRLTGQNLFGEGPDGLSETFRHFVGGLQRYLPECAPLFAPNINSFRRMRPGHAAPINLQWGYDNRSCGLRVPITDLPNTRIENRTPGADANPYLALAASLVCGYIGVRDRIAPAPMVEGNAYLHLRTLPRNLDEALDRFTECPEVIELLGESFVRAFLLIKADELNAYQGVISSWERDHLLLKV